MIKWETWMAKMGQQGKFISGQPLEVEGAVINGSKKMVTDGPFTKEKK